jgi:dihydrofolate reductase
MRYSLIVAMSENRVIGRRGQLPWRLSADLRRFKQLTMGHHVVLGRKTFESIGRTLPGRTMIVVSRQAGYRVEAGVAEHRHGQQVGRATREGRAAPECVLVARTLDDAKRLAAGDDEVFFIGGGEIYRQAMAEADRIYMTLVHAQVEGDTLFPELADREWRLVEQTRHAADEKNELDYTFLIYERVKHV